MALKHISYQQTGYFSALINDYLAEKETLQPFFNRFPRIENFEEQFYEKKDFFSKKKREILVASLIKQYEGFEVSNFSVGNNLNGNLPDLDSLKNYKQYLNYFDIPAFFHIGFGKKLKFDINFGPYLSFLLKNRSKLTDSNGQEMESTLIEGIDNIDWGFTYGAGIDYYLTDKISIGFDFLIEQGQKLITGAAIGDFKNFSQDFDFGVNFLLFEKKKKKLF